MSVASEITRIQGAKADIKTAIEGKGVSVPSAATIDEYAPYIDAISGGGSSGFTKGYAVGIGGQATLQFTVSGEPKAFVVTATSYSAGVLSVLGDSTGSRGIYAAASTYQHNYSTGFTASYSNGTLTITPPTGISFIEEDYVVVYYYGTGTLTFKTSTVSPGSGVTSVTFTGTGLTEVPAMYACLLESQVNSESYRRVALYTNSSWWNSYKSLGLTFFSNQIADTTSSFTESYNNGLVINSGGMNAGGYFHNPGTYTLYYLMAEDVEGGNLQNKTATPSTSEQVITADEGYDGLRRVTVSAVTASIDADIVAGNIKSGVEILGVTGTYSGGGSATVASTTTTVGSSNVSSISFTLSGNPKMFAVILQLASSGSYLTNSSTYVYDITSVISDGTNQYAIASRYNSSGTRAAREYYYTNYTKSYSNGTLTITAQTGVFVASNTYRIIYVY